MHLNTGLTTFLPVMNNRQQLVGLYPDFGQHDVLSRIGLMQQWRETQGFEALGGVSWLLRIDDLLSLPTDLHTRMNPAGIYLCIPEAQSKQQELQTRLEFFSKNGFQIMLDPFTSSFEFSWDATRHIAIDCRHGVPFHARTLAGKLSGGQCLAAQLPTYLEMEQAQAAGMNLFSGNYPFAPPLLNRTADGSAKTRLLKLLGLVARDADTPELEELFRQDAMLSFQLFKLVSTAAFGKPVKVSSFSQAINLLGRRQLQRWLQLLLYARQNDQQMALNPLMPRAAFRANMMESMCAASGAGRDELDSAYMAGMFSLLDKLFGAGLKEIIEPLNLSESVLSALLERQGKLGRCLQIVEAADRDCGEDLRPLLTALEISDEQYVDSALKAYAWVHQICREM